MKYEINTIWTSTTCNGKNEYYVYVMEKNEVRRCHFVQEVSVFTSQNCKPAKNDKNLNQNAE